MRRATKARERSRTLGKKTVEQEVKSKLKNDGVPPCSHAIDPSAFHEPQANSHALRSSEQVMSSAT